MFFSRRPCSILFCQIHAGADTRWNGGKKGQVPIPEQAITENAPGRYLTCWVLTIVSFAASAMTSENGNSPETNKKSGR